MGLFGRVIACVLVILAVLWVTKLEAAASGTMIVPEAALHFPELLVLGRRGVSYPHEGPPHVKLSSQVTQPSATKR